MIQPNKKICPRCDAPKMKNWSELSEDQKFLVERFPASAEFTKAQRKTHRFCTRCWLETHNETADLA